MRWTQSLSRPNHPHLGSHTSADFDPPPSQSPTLGRIYTQSLRALDLFLVSCLRRQRPPERHEDRAPTFRSSLR